MSLSLQSRRVNLEVIKGRLTETQVGAGVGRRTFGEFAGPRGELASYAFGRTTESEHQSGPA